MRLKIFTLSILFLFSFGQVNAQCEIVNGSYEEWIETEFILSDGEDGEVVGDVILPVGATPFLRLLFLTLASFSDPSYGMLLENEAQELSGILQSTDASQGNFAVKLQGGYGEPIADIFGVFSCTEVPDQFNMDVKHVGKTSDELSVFVIFDEGLNPVPQSEEDLANVPAYATTELLFDSNTEYETISLPIIQNFEAPIDTFYYVIIAETVDSGYFLIDNVNFENENSGCTVEAPTIAMSGSEEMLCICHGLDVDLQLEYDQDPALQYKELIIDEDGFIESIDGQGVHNEFCSSSDNLRVVVIAYEGDVEGLSGGSNIADLMGCFDLSNAIELETFTFPEFAFNIFVDDVQQGEELSICLMDNIIEVFSFSTDMAVDNIVILLISEETELVELRIDGIDETTTLPDIDPGDYFFVAVGYDDTFNLEVGQSAADITFEGCFSIAEEVYSVKVLGPNDNCVTNVDDIYIGDLSIRPNYSTGIFEIDNPNDEKYQFVVRDMTGKIVVDSNNMINEKLIDLINFPNGLYVASFQIDGYVHQEKIVKI